MIRIPLSAPDITEPEIDAVTAVLRGTTLSLGPQLEKFEQAFATLVGKPYAAGVSSGTAALHLALLALGVREGDEIIVPSFAFIAVANAVSYVRAVPVFVDIDPATLNLDPACIPLAITEKTRAIIVVHTFGCPADMDAIMAVARAKNLPVIEDACEAVGACYDGCQVGSLGDVSVFGFYPNKQLTTGEGGMLVTGHESIASRVRTLRNQGRSNTQAWFVHDEIGFNYRISEVQCALGLAQLRRLPEILEKRARVAQKYNEILSRHEDLIELPLLILSRASLSWFVYVVRLGPLFTAAHRDAVLQEMAKRGIACGRYFAPIHQQAAYATAPSRCTPLPFTEAIAPRLLALPFFNRISDVQISDVCVNLIDTLAGMAR